MTHRCPAADCTITVARDTFMCARHWRMIPRPLQAAIYDAYGRTNDRGENHREALRLVNELESARQKVSLPPGTKALTIWQPWASLIMLGAKPYEFRRWNFGDKPHLAKLIGRRIVIHAGARAMRDDELMDVLARIEEGESALAPQIAAPFVNALLNACKAVRDASAPRQAALGTATLGEPRNVVDLFKDEVADSDRLDQHMYAWPLTDIQTFPEPIPAAGAQGFWNWS